MSTELALIPQKEFVLDRFEDKQITFGISVDFSEAFDRIYHFTLFAKLEHYGFRGVPLELLRSYLTHRKQCISIKSDQSTMQKIQQGVPQGSILGPILFNTYINDLINITEDAHFIVYAKDTSIFFQSSDVNYLENLANDVLSKLMKWSTINSLAINALKTKAVLFTPPQKSITQILRYILDPIIYSCRAKLKR